MRTLRDWAEYYYEMGILVYPFPSQHYPWDSVEEWATFNQTLQIVRNYKWELFESLMGVSGKNGIRVLRLNINKEDAEYRSYCIDRIFSLLKLERYPWVIDTKDALEIIINCQSFFPPETFFGFRDMVLIYKGNFPLPCTGEEASFYFNGIPTIKPAVITQKALADCIEVLKGDVKFIKLSHQ